jgi:hypothetical protein
MRALVASGVCAAEFVEPFEVGWRDERLVWLEALRRVQCRVAEGAEGVGHGVPAPCADDPSPECPINLLSKCHVGFKWFYGQRDALQVSGYQFALAWLAAQEGTGNTTTGLSSALSEAARDERIPRHTLQHLKAVMLYRRSALDQAVSQVLNRLDARRFGSDAHLSHIHNSTEKQLIAVRYHAPAVLSQRYRRLLRRKYWSLVDRQASLAPLQADGRLPTIAYEDLVSRCVPSLSPIVAYLGGDVDLVPAACAVLQGGQTKVSRGTLADRIADWDAVRAYVLEPPAPPRSTSDSTSS